MAVVRIGMRIQEFLKDSLTLRHREYFSAIWLVSQEKWADLHQNFITDVSLDKNVPVKLWKSSGSGLPNPDTDFGARPDLPWWGALVPYCVEQKKLCMSNNNVCYAAESSCINDSRLLNRVCPSLRDLKSSFWLVILMLNYLLTLILNQISSDCNELVYYENGNSSIYNRFDEIAYLSQWVGSFICVTGIADSSQQRRTLVNVIFCSSTHHMWNRYQI